MRWPLFFTLLLFVYSGFSEEKQEESDYNQEQLNRTLKNLVLRTHFGKKAKEACDKKSSKSSQPGAQESLGTCIWNKLSPKNQKEVYKMLSYRL